MINEQKNLQNYLKYLMYIQSKLDKFFAAQTPYIFCEKGCSKCCKNARFPYSDVEMKYLILGTQTLELKVQKQIEQKIDEIIKEKERLNGKKIYHDCPFLIDGSCAVYNYRGVVCRAFGLMTNKDDKTLGVPMCCFEGLNYSNVVNLKTKKISVYKFKKLKTDIEPLSYNASYNFLTDNDFERIFDFSFGEKKFMLDWFYEYRKFLDN